MNNTVQKPDSILKSMTAFWIYDVVLVILFVFMPITPQINSDFSWWYLAYIYVCFSLIGAPILFGIWFGYRIGKKKSVPFGKKIIISILMFIINYFTYWIPIITIASSITRSPFLTYIPVTLLPAIGLTVVFLISSSVTSALHIN